MIIFKDIFLEVTNDCRTRIDNIEILYLDYKDQVGREIIQQLYY